MGLVRQIKQNIKDTKKELAQLREQHPDEPTTELEDELLDHLGKMIELLQQFED